MMRAQRDGCAPSGMVRAEGFKCAGCRAKSLTLRQWRARWLFGGSANGWCAAQGEDEGAMPEGYEVVHDLSELMSKIGDAKMIEVRRVDLETHMVLEEGQHAPDDGDGDEDDGSEGAGSSVRPAAQPAEACRALAGPGLSSNSV